MNNYHSKFIILAVLAFLGSCKGDHWQENKRKTYVVGTENPDAKAFEIINRSGSPTSFSIKINNSFYLDTKHMVDSVKQLSANLHESVLKSAWRLIKSATTNCNISYRHLQSELWVNSIGAGTCYDQATALAMLWKSLGYQARIWTLEGHVVPEVYTNNHWEMYDPSLKVYYLNVDHQVASVEELVSDTALFNNVPSDEMPNDIFSKAMCQSNHIRLIYMSKSNNHINAVDGITALVNDSRFTVPARATLTFPVFLSAPFSFVQNLAYLKLTIPKGSVGHVNIPLMLTNVDGAGTVSVDGKKYEIGSESLVNKFNDSTSAHGFFIERAEMDITCYYAINPILAALEARNVVVLSGDNVDSLQVLAAPLDSIYQLKNQSWQKALKNIANDYAYYFSNEGKASDKLNFGLRPVHDMKSLKAMIATYFHLDERLDKISQQELEDAVSHKIDLLLKSHLNPTYQNHLFELLNEPKPFVVFIAALRYLDEKSVINLSI